MNNAQAALIAAATLAAPRMSGDVNRRNIVESDAEWMLAWLKEHEEPKVIKAEGRYRPPGGHGGGEYGPSGIPPSQGRAYGAQGPGASGGGRTEMRKG